MIALVLFTLYLSCTAAYGPYEDVDYPFEWMQDSFEAGMPDPSLWDTSNPCISFLSSPTWTSSNNAGLNLNLQSGPCYLTPNFTNPRWNLPQEKPRGVMVRTNSKTVSSTTQQNKPIPPRACCFDRNFTRGIELGLRNVSYANVFTGQIESVQCPCNFGNFCPVSVWRLYEAWYFGSSGRFDLGSYTTAPNSITDGFNQFNYCPSGGFSKLEKFIPSGCWGESLVTSNYASTNSATLEIRSSPDHPFSEDFRCVPAMPAQAIPTSFLPLNGTTLSWLRFGGVPSSSPGQSDSADIAPWGYVLYRMAINFAGQCYDNNTQSGDGCYMNWVEPFCACAPVGSNFKVSSCQCRTRDTFLSLSPSVIMANFSSFNNETLLVGASPSSRVDLPYSGENLFIMRGCFHVGSCLNTNVSHQLVLFVNGTSRAPMETLFRLCPLSVCNTGEESYIIDLSSLPPFPLGTELQFTWWSNTLVDTVAGLLDVSGPVFSASPIMKLIGLEPKVFTTNPVFYLAGATQTITFGSNIRDPRNISLWMYEGQLSESSVFPPSFDVSDAAMTKLNASCSSAASPAPIRHTCSVDIPFPRFLRTLYYLVARVDYGAVLGVIAPIGVNISSPALVPLDTPVPLDTKSITITFQAISLDSATRISLYVDSSPVDATILASSRNSSSASFLLNRNLQGQYFFPKTGNLIAALSDNTQSRNVTVGTVVQSPITLFDTPSIQYFLENRTLVLQGAGFVADRPEYHTVYLSQGDGSYVSLFCIPTNVTLTRLWCQLDGSEESQPLDGALFASVVILDGHPTSSRLIGYYSRTSVFDQIQTPEGINLQVSPRLQFRLDSSGFNAPPNFNTLNAPIALLSSQLGLSATDFFARFSLTSLRPNSTYELEIYFITNAAFTAFSGQSVPTSTDLIESIKLAIGASTGDVYKAELSFASVQVNSNWPYLFYQLTSPTRTAALSRIEQTAIRTLAATSWDLPPSSLYLTYRASQSIPGYDLNVYFQNSLSGSIFTQYQLPINDSAVGNPMKSIVFRATNGTFTLIFIRSSPFVRESQTIDVSWPWIRFRLSSFSGNASLTTADRERLVSSSVSLFNVSFTDVVLQVSEISQKRAVADLSLTLFFATRAGQSAFFSLGMPFNTSIIEAMNLIVQNVTSGGFNSTYIGSNIVAPSSGGVVGESGGIPIVIILAIAIPIVVVALVLLVVAIVFFRRRTLQMRRLKAQVESLPEDLKAVLSIKSSELIFGKKLGEGSFGAVFKGEYNGKKVAIKKLSASMISAQVADFFREASVMLSIKPHDNVVRMIGMCQEFGTLSMVMQYCQHGTLEEFVRDELREQVAIDEVVFFKLARGIANGMAHLAASGVVHRDLAARNILLDDKFRPKVSDFGFSRVLGEDQKGKTKTAVGPVRWMSPENIARQEYSEKSDVWSFGALLIEMLTGEVPFPGQDTMAVAVSIRDRTATALDYLPKQKEFPAWIIQVIQKCFTLDDTARPSFTDVIQLLDSVAPSGANRSNYEDVESAVLSRATSRKRAKSQIKNKEASNITPERYEEMEEM